MRKWIVVALLSLFIGATAAAAVSPVADPTPTSAATQEQPIALRRYQYLIQWEGGQGSAGASGQGAVLWERNLVKEQHNVAFVDVEGALVGRGIDERGTAMLLPSGGDAGSLLGLMAFEMLFGHTVSPDSISDWLEGKESTTWVENGTVTTGKDGRVARIVEGGWVITYLAWGATTEGTKTSVPTKVQIQHGSLIVTLDLMEAGAYPGDALPKGYRPFTMLRG